MLTEKDVTRREAALYISGLAKRITENIESVIIGKRHQIQIALVALFSEGHLLIEDVPGVAKTVLAKSLAKSVGCTFQRVQCTPDLLPSDITGVSVYNQKTGEFEFRHGPAFANILLADELNRATPRTQSALLECMAEGQITLDGKTHHLARPFFTIATQNPIEYEGTFPLPEAQLDRFCLRTKLGYPDEEAELGMLERLRAVHPIDTLNAVTTPHEIAHAQELVRQVFVHDDVRRYIVKLVRATRFHQDIAVGASPRATLALFRMAQALAAISGWEYVVPDFVRELAPSVLEHRLVLKPETRFHRKTAQSIIWDVIEHIPAPKPKGKS